MFDPDVIPDDDIESEETDERRDRRWWALIAVILLLLLMSCCVVTQAQQWTTGGAQRARFVARNVECVAGCHTSLIPDFDRPVLHAPFAQKECTTCHTPHGKKVGVTIFQNPAEVWRRYTTTVQWLPLKWFLSITQGDAGRISVSAAEVDASSSNSVNVKGVDSTLVMPEDELCFMCHGDMGVKMADPYQHQPFEARRCSNCHDPHSSDYRGMLTMAPEDLCLTCHPIGAELARDQQHSPVANGSCIDCHDPHASQFKGILTAAQSDLCYQCHPSVAILDSMPVQHAPFVNNDCTSCHEPHGSDYRPLLNALQPALCYRCHPEIANQFKQPSHHPVGVTLTCSSCHDPHAADYAALITAQDNKFCYRCHSQVRETYDASGHEVVLCVRCHTPHGSDTSPMLTNANPPLCLECHEPMYFDEGTSAETRNNHPVRPTHFDVNARENLTCTSSCHNPHGTKLNFMLRYFDYPEDGACLICHAAVPGATVSIDF